MHIEEHLENVEVLERGKKINLTVYCNDLKCKPWVCDFSMSFTGDIRLKNFRILYFLEYYLE